VNRLSEKQLLLVTIGVTLLLCSGIGWLIWGDLDEIEQEETKTATLRQDISKAEAEISKIPTREYRVIANREIADREVAFLPAAEDIENFWEILERYAAESGIRISEIAPTGGKKKKVSGPIKSVPQILTVKGTVDEFLRFMNLVENHDRIINVVEYHLSAGETAALDDPTKIRHGIKLALTTFTYNKHIANTIVSIPQYEKKKSHPEVARWRSKIKIQEKETYALRTSLGRRDPFINVRRVVETAGEGDAIDLKRVEAIIERLAERIRTLEMNFGLQAELAKRKDMFRLHQQLKENREAFEALRRDIEQVRRDKLIRDPQLAERFRTDVIEPFGALSERIKANDKAQPPMPLMEVKQRFDVIAKDFDERNWDDVRRQVRAFLDLTRDGDHVVEEARSWVERIHGLLRRSNVIRKFEKRKIEISTIIYSPSALSLAIINGKMKSEGDALDADGQVVIAEIGTDYVIFETEGVEIKKLKGER